MQNTIVYLFGFPGTGKYTIAKELVAQTGARLIDNHLICNPIFSVLRPDGKTSLPSKTWDYTKQVADIVRDAMVNLSTGDENFVITNALTEESEFDRKIYSDWLTVAEKRKALFVPVRLSCALPELQSRIISKDRHERMKMTDPVAIADHYQNYTVLNPDHPYKLELDVTNLSIVETVDIVMAHMEKLQK